MAKLFSGLFDSNEKEIKRLEARVKEINDLKSAYQQLGISETNPKLLAIEENLRLMISKDSWLELKNLLANVSNEYSVFRGARSGSDGTNQLLTEIKKILTTLEKNDEELEESLQSNNVTRMATPIKNIRNSIEAITKNLTEMINLVAEIQRLADDPGLEDNYLPAVMKSYDAVPLGDITQVKEIVRAKENLLQAKITRSIRLLNYCVETIEIQLGVIWDDLKGFTPDELKVKTYEFKNRICVANKQLHEEISKANSTLISFTSTIAVVKATDGLVKSLLLNSEAELQTNLKVAQQEFQEAQANLAINGQLKKDHGEESPDIRKRLQLELQEKQDNLDKVSKRLTRIQDILEEETDERILKYSQLIKNELSIGEPYQTTEFDKYMKEKKSSSELPSQIKNWKADIARNEKREIDTLLPDAFAAMREAAKRHLKQEAFDVQLMGAITLHQGKIAEMKTGEGKTLTATFALYLNSLAGKGAHLVTVNDYLARRDPYWMGPVFHALGVSIASIYPMQGPDEHSPARIYDPEYDSGDTRWPHFRAIQRAEAYKADITYGTSSEFGFDYLRDNMVDDISRCVQQPLYYAIVDEVDNLLIDEARTPLIISAPDVEAGQLYKLFARLVTGIHAGTDYEINEKERLAEPTEEGWEKVERMLRRDGALKSPNLFDSENGRLIHHLRNALTAKEFYKRDRQYVIDHESDKSGEIIIVDEYTGRKMYGRRYSDGLHQAIEAKEGLRVREESKTYATITIQNYFRMYEKLAGMTGTAMTEAEEFFKIYELEVTEIPTNKPNIREDYSDLVYKTEEGKFRAVVKDIKEIHDKGAPVLIGTVSIEKSEYIKDVLKRQGIDCKVLNAKEHTKEAEIIAHAGEPGAVTVATNMAGRGVDIILGGTPNGNATWQADHEKVLAAGGLHVIGTERHEDRRIDNQLRGRAGRQGDPGMTRFYVSIEDDIMRRFGGDRMKTVMNWVGIDEDTPIENKMITNAITDVQKRVEGYNFDIRKHLVEYDDVVNKHRELIYQERRKILEGADLKSNILSMINQEIEGIIKSRCSASYSEDWEIPELINDVNAVVPLPRSMNEEHLRSLSKQEILEAIRQATVEEYEKREIDTGSANMRMLERLVMLQIIDRLWVEHLTAMEEERRQAAWQTLRQVKSADAYRRSGFENFGILKDTIQQEVARTIFRVRINPREEKSKASEMEKAAVGAQAGASARQPVRAAKKVGRNDPCPCGSGKKYKNCCGK